MESTSLAALEPFTQFAQQLLTGPYTKRASKLQNPKPRTNEWNSDILDQIMSRQIASSWTCWSATIPLRPNHSAFEVPIIFNYVGKKRRLNVIAVYLALLSLYSNLFSVVIRVNHANSDASYRCLLSMPLGFWQNFRLVALTLLDLQCWISVRGGSGDGCSSVLSSV